MVVVVSNGNTNISTPNGFYRAESSNPYFSYVGTITATTTPVSFPVTFANACNLKGIVLGLWSLSQNITRGVRINLQERLGTFTVNIASPAVFTMTAHGLNNLDEVILESTGLLPTGLTKSLVRYYVRNKTDNTFNISTTTTGALINTTGTQSGTHTLWVTRMTELFDYTKIHPPVADALGRDSIYSFLITPFEFTTPYAVDTTSNKWRFSNWTEGGTGTYYFTVSDGVLANNNVAHIAWGDNLVSFTNGDTLICKDKVTIDQNTTL